MQTYLSLLLNVQCNPGQVRGNEHPKQAIIISPRGQVLLTR
jgi:hypothetical protein